ncbi:MAG: hypothetical protein ACYDEV_15865 [Acidiferrobacter sp.]
MRLRVSHPSSEVVGAWQSYGPGRARGKSSPYKDPARAHHPVLLARVIVLTSATWTMFVQTLWR